MPGPEEENAAAQSPAKSLSSMELEYSNGHHDSFSSSDAEEGSGNGEVSSALGNEEKIARLTQENQKLSSEIGLLRGENESVARCVLKLEKQVRDDADKLDSMIREAEGKKVEVLGEIQAVRREVSMLRQEKSELAGEKERLELQLALAGKNISELSKKVDDAESAAASAKEKAELLDAEFKKLSSDRQKTLDMNSGLKSLNDGLVAEVKVARSSRDSLDATLSKEKARFSEGLKEAEAEVARLRSRLEEAESSSDKSRHELVAAEEKLVAALNRVGELELERSTRLELEAENASTERELEAENQTLKSTLRELGLENETLVINLQQLETGNDSLKSTLQQAEAENRAVVVTLQKLESGNEALVVALRQAEAENESLKSTLQHLGAANETLVLTLQQLEAENLSLKKALQELDAENKTGFSARQVLESKVIGLEHKLSEVMAEQVLIAAELQKERELRGASVDQALALNMKKNTLEGEVKQALSTVQKMQEITQSEQGQRKALEEQVAGALREKLRVEEMKAGVEAELKQAVIKSKKASITSQAEVVSLKQKIENLESALGKVKDEAHSSEKKVWQLIAELSSARELLEKKASFAKFAVPAALVSTGALAITGVVTYLRHKQHAL